MPRVLSVVNIDTASSNGSSHELSIKGLKQPKEFKELVWKVKREGGSGDTRSMNPMNPMIPRPRSMWSTRGGRRPAVTDNPIIQ